MTASPSPVVDKPVDLLGRHVHPAIDPLEIADPQGLPGGTVVRVFDQEPPPYSDLCVLVRLDEETIIRLPGRHRTIALRHVMLQLGEDWDVVRKYLHREVPDWQVKFLLHGSFDPRVETVLQIDWSMFTAIAPGLVALDA